MAFEKDGNSNATLEIWRNTFTADGAGAFTAQSIPNTIGLLTRVEWSPGGTTPDSTTTIKVNNSYTIDALNGSGANKDMTAAGACWPVDGNSNFMPTTVSGPLSVAITTNSTASAVVTIAVHITRLPRQ